MHTAAASKSVVGREGVTFLHWSQSLHGLARHLLFGMCFLFTPFQPLQAEMVSVAGNQMHHFYLVVAECEHEREHSSSLAHQKISVLVNTMRPDRTDSAADGYGSGWHAFWNMGNNSAVAVDQYDFSNLQDFGLA